METNTVNAREENQVLHKKYLGVRDAASYLGLSLSQIYFLTSRRLISYSKPGKQIFFLRSDLDAFIMKNRIEAVEGGVK